MPFLLPLLLQIGFGLTPFEFRARSPSPPPPARFLMKFTASTVLRWFGFRQTLVVNGLISGAVPRRLRAVHALNCRIGCCCSCCSTGGFFRSLEFTALNAISYADIEQPQMSRATSFASVSQQMSGAVGVAVAAICVELSSSASAIPSFMARDLSLAFVLVAIISSLSVFVFATSSRTQARRFRVG